MEGADQESIGAGAGWRWAVVMVSAVTVFRIGLLFVTTLELYPDEAQYWLWSRHLAFGYFSKPPMIAWLIGLTTAIGGDGEPWVRLSAPLMHAGAALAIFRAGRRLYDGRTGFMAALLYTLISGVQLSSVVIATDAPLMLFVSLAIWAYAVFWTSAAGRARLIAAALLGLALGAGVLTKYAAVYMVAGVALHAVLDPEARRRWTPGSIGAAVAAGVLVASPNLIWNALHHFQTIAHTADNADIGDNRAGLKGLLGVRGPFGFVLGQFGVVGPLSFGIVIAAAWRAVRRREVAADLLLVSLAAPAFVVVLIESVLARANANWAGASYPACALLAGAALTRWRTPRLRLATVGVQIFIAIGFVAAVVLPGLPDAVGASAALKRARGWRAVADQVVATAEKAGPLAAVAVDDRFLFNALSYYGRDAAGRPAGRLPAPLRAWIHLEAPANQAEAEAALPPGQSGRVLGVSGSKDYLAAFRADFSRVMPVSPAQVRVRLDPSHERVLDLFIGERYLRQPRDAHTGRPVPPPAGP